MIYYFDTSALLKKYILEKGSQKVLALFEEESDLVLTSKIASLEAFHGITRKAKEEKLSPKTLSKLLRQLEKDFNDFELVEINSELFKRAKELIQKYLLKTLDAIHLASALLLKEEGLEACFISCDLAQLKAARSCGLKVFNPC